MRAALVLTVLAITAGAARAEDRVAPLDLRREVPIVAGNALFLLVTEWPAKDALSPASCRWCDDNALDRGVRDALVWDDPVRANLWSNVAIVATPVAGAGLLEVLGPRGRRGRESVHNLLILAEAGMIASNLGHVVKLVAARERPFVHQLAPADKPFTDKPSENNLSFYSGHSTVAMSLAVAAGTTATLRGYRHHTLVWATAVPLALATGYLRIAADKHYTTDVAVGWLTGAAVGVAVPYLLHRRCPVAPTVARTRHATTVGLAVTW